MNKTLISIVGPTTVGKSTFASALLHKGLCNDICPVPLAVQRDLRKDDDPRLVVQVSKDHNESMFFNDTPYGVLQESIDEFMASDALFGLSISTPMGLAYVKERLKEQQYIDVNHCNIVITLTENKEDELQELSERIDRFFPDKESNEWRKKFHLSFVDKYFFNVGYMESNCDLHLVQNDNTVADWITQLDEFLSSTLLSDKSLLQSATNSAMQIERG